METECKRDEDYGTVWGAGGKTAKMKAAQTCYNNAYYKADIKDCGDWRFKAVCSEPVPKEWSKPYSDESAREAGFNNRNDAARQDCKNKGFSDIDPNTFMDKGEFFYSLKCTGGVSGGAGGVSGSAGDCKRDEDYGSMWGVFGKTAKMKAAQKCYDSGKYNAKIIDCGDWKFRAECSEDTPKDWSKPYSDESAREEGFKDRNDAAREDCKKKGGIDIDPKMFRDKGEFFYSLKCISAECKKDEDYGSIWGVGGKTAKMKAAQKCYNSGKYNAKIIDCGEWRFDAECSEDTPKDWSKPYSDESAREEGFKDRNDAAREDCKKKGFGGIDSNEFRDKGEFFYSLKCKDVKWDTPVTGCDGAGSKLTIQKCNDWLDNDVNSCNTSPIKPKVVKWINCAIGSSPGGIAPGDGATVCSPLSKGPDDFTCALGQNCFAVTEQIEDESICPNTNPISIVGNFFNKYQIYIIIAIIIIAVLSVGSSVYSIFK